MVHAVLHWLSRVFVELLCHLIVRLYFSDIEIIGRRKLPKHGPIIFVGNHNNQFLDGLLMATQMKRSVKFLVAKKSFSRPLVGFMATAMGAIPVERPQDLARKGSGTISICEDDAGKCVVVRGEGTRFTSELVVGESLKLAGVEDPVRVAEIVDDALCTLRRPADEPLENASYKIFPAMDQGEVYSAVWTALASGQSIGIFPEGGSHDRPSLLPLKAGVTIMALGACSKHNTTVHIVPCGLSYFGGDRFRGNVVMEYGDPITIEPGSDLVRLYEENRRAACSNLLKQTTRALESVTVNVPTLELRHAMFICRSLYIPAHVELDSKQFMELNRRMAVGLEMFKDRPEAQTLIKDALQYSSDLKELGLRDYQVAAGPARISAVQLQVQAVIEAVKLGVLIVLLLPAYVGNWPIGKLAANIAKAKSVEATQASSVKIRGQDVVSSYKVIYAFALVPSFYLLYAVLAWLLFDWRWGIGTLVLFPIITYLSIPIAETGFAEWRTLQTIWKATVARDKLLALQEQRSAVQAKLRDLIEKLGPEQDHFDFDGDRIVSREEIEVDTARPEAGLQWRSKPFRKRSRQHSPKVDTDGSSDNESDTHTC